MWCYRTLYSSLKENLSKSFTGALEEVVIPDTIIFDEEHNPIEWYYSPKQGSGVMKNKSKHVTRAKIFRALATNSEYVIVANIIWYENNVLGGKIPQLHVRYLDEHELRCLLLGSDSAGKPLEKLDGDMPSIGTNWILQRFVAIDSRGVATTICSECMGAQRFSIKRITNNHYFHGHSRKYDACLTVECYDTKHVREERLSDQVIKSCSDISEIVQQCLLKDSATTSSINLYFSQDKNGRIWLKWALYVSSNLPTVQYSEDGSSVSNSITEPILKSSKICFLVSKLHGEYLCSIYEKVFGIKNIEFHRVDFRSNEIPDPHTLALTYDDKVIKEEELLDMFWNNLVHPSSIYYFNDNQKNFVELSLLKAVTENAKLNAVSIHPSSSIPTYLANNQLVKSRIEGIAFQNMNLGNVDEILEDGVDSRPFSAMQVTEISLLQSKDKVFANHSPTESTSLTIDLVSQNEKYHTLSQIEKEKQCIETSSAPIVQQSNKMMAGWNGTWQSAIEVDQNRNNTDNNSSNNSNMNQVPVTSLNPIPLVNSREGPSRPISAVQIAERSQVEHKEQAIVESLPSRPISAVQIAERSQVEHKEQAIVESLKSQNNNADLQQKLRFGGHLNGGNQLPIQSSVSLAQQSNEMSGWQGAWQSAMEVDQSYSSSMNKVQVPFLNPVPPVSSREGKESSRPTSAAQRGKAIQLSNDPTAVDPSKSQKSFSDTEVKVKRYEQISKPKLKPALALDRQKVIELNHMDFLQKVESRLEEVVIANKTKKRVVPVNKYAKLLRKSKWIIKKKNEKKRDVVLPAWVDNNHIDYKCGHSKPDTVLSELDNRVKKELESNKKAISKNTIHIPTAPKSAPSSRSTTSAKSFRRPNTGDAVDSMLDIEDDDKTNKSMKSFKSKKSPQQPVELTPEEVLEQSKEFGKPIVRQKPIVVLQNGKEIFGPKVRSPPLPPPGMPDELVEIVEVIIHNVCANLFSCLDKSRDVAISHREGIQSVGSSKRIDANTIEKIIDFIENGPNIDKNNVFEEFTLPLSDDSGKSFIEALQLISCTPNHRPVGDLVTIVMWILSSERDSTSDEKEFANIMKSFTKYAKKAKKLVAEVGSICQGRGPLKDKDDKPRWNAAVKLRNWYDRRHAPKENEQEDDSTVKPNIIEELELNDVDFVNSINSHQMSYLTINSKSNVSGTKSGHMTPASVNKAVKDPRNNGSNITSSLPLSTTNEQEVLSPGGRQYKYSKVQKLWDNVPSKYREIRKPAAAGIIQKLGTSDDPPGPKKKVVNKEDLNLQVHVGMETLVTAAKWKKKTIYDDRDGSKRNEMLTDDCYEAVSSVSIDGFVAKTKSLPTSSIRQDSEVITTLNSEIIGKFESGLSTPLNEKSMSSLSNNVMMDEDDDDLDMTLSPMSPNSSVTKMSPMSPKDKSVATVGQSFASMSKASDNKRGVEKIVEDKEAMFYKLAPKINSLQRKMFIVSLVSDSARTLILCVLVLIKHTQAGKEVKYEDLLNLFGKPVARKIGQSNLLALLRWLKANRRSEVNFIPSHERYLEFALQRLFAYWPDTWVNVSEVNTDTNTSDDNSIKIPNDSAENRAMIKQTAESKIIPIQKEMKTTVRLKWPDKFRVTKLFLEPHALEPNLNFI